MPKLGFLDPSADCEDITKDTKLELPFWLAKDLYSEGLVDILVPKGYNQTFREILEADANCVNLHKLGPNYYRFGQHLSHMSIDESEDIAKSLVETFHQRYHRLVNYALNATNDTINEVLSFNSQLDNEEKDLFNIGKQSSDQMKNWENRSIEKVTANDLVISLRKRKRIAMEDNSHNSSQSTSQSNTS
jgi:GINS complex subunit 3